MPKDSIKKIVFASLKRDGSSKWAKHDAEQAFQAAKVKRRVHELGFFKGNLNSAINAALKAGAISEERAERWHAVRKADNYCKHDEERLNREKGGGGGGGRKRRRRRQRHRL